MNNRIADLSRKLMDTFELPKHKLEEIRARYLDTEHLTSGFRCLETTPDGDTEVVAYHHNAGRLVLATVPEWATGMAEHIKHAHADIDRLLTEVRRLQDEAALQRERAFQSHRRELDKTT